MRVLGGPVPGRTASAIAIDPGRDRPVPRAVEVLPEDPPHVLGRFVIDRQHSLPETLRRLARVQVRPTVDHPVPRAARPP